VKIVRTRSDEAGSRLQIQFRGESKADADSLLIFSIKENPQVVNGYELSSISSYSKMTTERFDQTIKEGNN
jgi:hypothetical protein